MFFAANRSTNFRLVYWLRNFDKIPSRKFLSEARSCALESKSHQFGKLCRLGLSPFEKSLIISVCLIFLAISLNESVSAQIAQPSLPQEIYELKQGAPVEREILQKETHLYRIKAKTGDFVRVVVVQKNADVGLTAFLPGGEKFYAVDNANNREENEKFSFVAETGGEFQIEVRFVGPLAGKVAGKGYEIRLENLRAATDKDQVLINAERLYDKANLLRFEDNEAKRREALKVFQSAIPLFAQAGDRRGEAFSFFAIGQVNSLLSDYAESKKNYDAAIAIFRELGARPQLGMALEAEAPIYFRENNIEKSVELLNQALEIYRELDYRKGIAKITGNFGAIYARQNQPRRALEHYEKALPLLVAENDKSGTGRIYNNLGYLYDDLGEPLKALDSYNESLKIFQEIGDGYMQANILSNRALIYEKLGEPEKGVESLLQALEMFQKRGDRNGTATSFNNLAASYQNLGEAERAREFYEKALSLNREIKSLVNEAAVLLNYASLKTEQQDFAGAGELLLQSLQIFRQLKNKRGESRALVKLGEIAQKKGARDESLSFFQQALPVLREIEDRDWEGLALYLIGDRFRLNEDFARGRQYCQDALKIKREIRQPLDEAAALFCLAKIEKAVGDLPLSQSHIEAAIEKIEQVRGKLARQDFRASYFARNQEFYDFYIDLLLLRHRLEPKGGFDALALKTSERARARNLLESLGESRVDIQTGVAPELLEKERALRQTINAKDAQRLNALRSKSTEKVKEFEKEINELLQKYQNVKTEIRAKSPAFSVLTQPEPLDLKAIQMQIPDENSVLLEYFLGEQRSFLFVVTKNSLDVFELPKREIIESIARETLESLKARGQETAGETALAREERLKKSDLAAQKSLQRLSQILIDPAAEKIRGKRLLIVGAGVLQYVPFAALRAPGSAGAKKHFLVETNEIVNLPSASVVAALRQNKIQRESQKNLVAILADPVFSSDDPRLKALAKQKSGEPGAQGQMAVMREAQLILPSRLRSDFGRLRFSRTEAEAISGFAESNRKFVAVDFAANLKAATSENLRNSRIIHLATHGVINSNFPELSGVVLSLVGEDGAPQDGFLRLHDIYNLRLNADLIVLSACETALGKEIRGEGVVGLARGFMYAGAPRVVASLWRVEDRATADLMRRFYQKMLKENMSPAAALRSAQVSMIGEKTSGHPFFWAGFTLQGDWK